MKKVHYVMKIVIIIVIIIIITYFHFNLYEYRQHDGYKILIHILK